MRLRYFGILAATLSVAVSAPASSQTCGPLGSGSQLCRIPDASLEPPGADPKRLKYGSRHWQDIRLYTARTGSAAPLVVVLGEDSRTEWLRHRLTEAGFSVAFVRYSESVPTADAAIEAYTSAIGFLRREAAELKLDTGRIALFGSGEAAHLAALLGTNPELLENAGVPFSSVQAVIGLDGTGFDIPRRMAQSRYRASLYRRTFGRKPEDHLRLSPTSHLSPPNAPAFLMMAEEEDREATAETKEMVDAFAAAGIEASFVALPAYRFQVRSTYFMAEPETGSGSAVLPFLRARMGVR